MRLGLCLLAAITLSTNLMAKVDVELLKKSPPKFQYVSILKEKKVYFLNYRSFGYYNSKGEQIDSLSGVRNYRIIYRNIKVPVKIELNEKSGFGNTIQLLGFGDDDIKTGDFKNLEGLRFGDLFTSYEGSSTNIGLTFIGGGYTTMTAANGATLKEGNGSILFIGPAGTPIGINSGIHHIKFDMTISTILKAVAVDYESRKYVEGKLVDIDEAETHSESMDEVAQIEL